MGKAQERETFARVLESDALPLLRELGRFAAQRSATAPERIAAERFPFWQPPLNRVKGARLLDYLIFDYRHDKHGPSAAEEYFHERAPLLAPQQSSLLREWIGRHVQLYVCEGWSAGFVQCTAVDRGGTQTSLDVLPLELETPPIAAGKPIALRALPVGGAALYPSWPITFGDRSPQDVLEAIRARHHAFVRRERIVSFEEFLGLEPTVFDEEAAVRANASRIIVPGR